MILKPYTLIALVLILLLGCQNKKAPSNDTKQTGQVAISFIEEETIGITEPEEEFDEDISENLKSALKQLGLKQSDCNMSFYTEKVLPYNKELSVMIIPIKQLSNDEQSEYDFALDAYIVLIDNESGKITNKLFKANAWSSDAMVLGPIEIDTAPYQLDEGTRAFGVRAYYTGSSRVNPYWYEEISLYIPQNNTLAPVLSGYVLAESHGEFGGTCEGWYKKEDAVIIIDDEKTSEYYNITISTTTTNTVDTLPEKGDDDKDSDDDDCITETMVTKSTKTLKFNGTEYK